MNDQAICFNRKVKNIYGELGFLVSHSGGLTDEWYVKSRSHLDKLLNIERNMGYILTIDNIVPIND